jgi:ubiquinol-cytochrome c reductase cytochrome b subunit
VNRAPARGLGRLFDWIDRRSGWVTAVRALAREPIPGGAAWFHTLGAIALFLLALELVTGVLLALWYAPSAATAWASVAFIQDQLTAGWFVRGLHSFGSSALIVVAALHLMQVLIWGAHRAPRELNWLVGLAMLGLVLASALTGYGLPWDQAGYWAKLVEVGVLGGTPLVGPLLERVVQGGGGFGSYTVTHLYTAHVVMLPAALLGLGAVHGLLVRRHRLTPHWSCSEVEAARTSQPYFPDQAVRDAFGATLVFAALVALVLVYRGAALEAPADPASSYLARPQWYALPLYQLRLLFQGPLEPVATLLLPGVAAGLLAALPFIDRGGDRRPQRRPLVMTGLALGLAGLMALGVMPVVDDARDPAFARHRRQVTAEAAQARQLAGRGVLPAGGTAVWHNDPAFEARALFDDRCAGCHTRDGEGGGEGPDLLDYNSRRWLTAFLRNPYAPRFFGGAKKADKGRMKPVEATDEEIGALAEFVYAQSGAPDVDLGLARQGRALFEGLNCDACHEANDPRGEAGGPNLVHRGRPDNIRRVIEHAGAPNLYGERSKMPRFAGKLAPEQIDQLTALVLQQQRR